MIEPEPGLGELPDCLKEQGLVEATGFVQHLGGQEFLRVYFTGRGWVEFKAARS